MNSKKHAQQNRIKNDADYDNRIIREREARKYAEESSKKAYLHGRNMMRDLTMIKAYLRSFDIQTLTHLWEETLGTVYRILMKNVSVPRTKSKLVNALCIPLYKRMHLSLHGVSNFKSLLFPEHALKQLSENALWQSVNYKQQVFYY